jgi:hypothetical protein
LKSFGKDYVPLLLRPERKLETYKFEVEMFMFIEMIHCGVLFALSRFGDGEFLLMKGIQLSLNTNANKVDKWNYLPKKQGRDHWGKI